MFKTSRIWSVLAWGSVVLLLPLSLYVHLALAPYAFDDAYIHFRVARAWVTRGAPYFNPGEAVMVSTSSGWVLVLAALLWLSSALPGAPDLPTLAAIWNAVTLLAGAVVYTRLLATLARRALHPALAAGYFMLYLALLRPPSLGLMETPTALLLVGLALHGVLKRKPWAASLLSAAVFFRPELLAVLGLSLLYLWHTRRFSWRKLALWLVLGALPFVVYDLAFYGTLVPNTIHAKAQLYDLSYDYVAGSLVRALIPSINLPRWRYHPPQGLVVGYVLALLAVLCVGYGYRLARHAADREDRERDSFVVLLLLWGLAVAGAYWLSTTFVFPWYVPLFTLPLSLALAALLAEARKPLAVLGLLLLLLPLLLSQAAGLWQVGLAAFVDPVYYQDFGPGARVRHYLAVGRELYARYPQATLMTSEIGGLGYMFHGYVIDGAGLVSPDALRYHPMRVPEERSHGAIGAIPVGYIEEKRPDIIVSLDIFIEAFLASDARLAYRQVRYPIFLPDDAWRSQHLALWGSQRLNVFFREDIVAQYTPVPERFLTCNIQPVTCNYLSRRH